jgi:hypothetical protein
MNHHFSRQDRPWGLPANLVVHGLAADAQTRALAGKPMARWVEEILHHQFWMVETVETL